MIILSVSVDKAVIVRYETQGHKFEILVDPRKAWEIKKGNKVQMDEVLAYPAVYKDARAPEMAAEKDLQKVFGTTDVFTIAEQIIKRGDFRLTTEQRREMLEQKKNQIANIISKKGINPQTNTPHPPQRILNAMQQVGVNVDPFLDAELQVEKVLKAIKQIIPIKFEKVLIRLKFGPQFAGRVYSIIKKAGEIKKEDWLTDGSLQVEAEIFAGAQDELFKKLADLTHGQFESKLLRRIDV